MHAPEVDKPITGLITDLRQRGLLDVIWNHDVHATLLHLLGMEHKKLTYYFNGRNMRLTDVSGELIPQIVGDGKTSPVTA